MDESCSFCKGIGPIVYHTSAICIYLLFLVCLAIPYYTLKYVLIFLQLNQITICVLEADQIVKSVMRLASSFGSDKTSVVIK